MDEEYLIFADADAMYPGNIIRKAQPVNWSSLLQTSIQRQRQYNKKKKQSVQPSPSNSPSHTSASASAPTSSSSRLSGPDQISSSMSALADVTASVSTTSGIDVVRESSSMSPPVTASTRGVSLADKICTLLSESTLQLDAVKKFSWAGLPSQYRAPIWKLLLGYAPKTAERRPDTIERKRREYREAVDQHYAAPVALPSGEGALNDSQLKYSSSDSNATSTIHDDVTMRQIAVDIPRTSPGQRLFQIPDVQLALQRVLYVWAVRHPASGYVQGMNDLVTPFMYVFLADYADNATRAVLMHASDLSTLSDAPTALANAEADAYWCLTALLNDIQDYYTFSQPGIQRRVHFLRELVSRVDANLCSHLEEQGLDFLQFSFRWMNCLLMRELPFPVIVRVWDTYLAEADGFAVFHVYVCAALLVSFSEELLEMEFQDLVMFLQNLPTQNWTEKNIDIILSQAYLWRTIFGASPSHLQ